MRRLFANVLLALSIATLPSFAFAASSMAGMAHSSSSRAPAKTMSMAMRKARRLGQNKSSSSSSVRKSSSSAAAKTGKGTYGVYSADLLKQPGTVVLFFMPYSCGSACKMRDADLHNWYGSENLSVSTYKIASTDPDYVKLAHDLRMSGNLDGFIKAQIASDGSITFVKGLVHPFDDALKAFLQ